MYERRGNLSYLMVHLTIGYKLLELCPDIEDMGAFLLGTVSPDAIMFRPGCIRSDKSNTHFCIGNEGWGYYTNYDEWLASLTRNIRDLSGTNNRDFLFGYMSHIITDIENTKHFWTPIRLSNDQEYINLYIKDCGEIDSILLRDIENVNYLWSTLKNSNKHCLPDLFKIEDNSLLIDKMSSEMYFDRYPTPNYSLSIFTMSKALRFMDETINSILKHKECCAL